MSRFIILMYHDLDSKDTPSEKIRKGDLLYVLDVERFEEQMQYLNNNNFHVTTLDEMLRNPAVSTGQRYRVCNEPKKSIILTFDDGHITNYTKAFPILKKYGLKAHFFVTVGWIDTSHHMTEEMIKQLSDYGMTIGSHGMTHRYLNDLNEDEILWELKESKRILGDVTGEAIRYFAAPGGRINRRITSISKALDYRGICTSLKGYSIDSDPFGLRRLAIKRNTSLKAFKSIVNGDHRQWDIIKSRWIDGWKKLLGNHLYEELREKVLGIGS